MLAEGERPNPLLTRFPAHASRRSAIEPSGALAAVWWARRRSSGLAGRLAAHSGHSAPRILLVALYVLTSGCAVNYWLPGAGGRWQVAGGGLRLRKRRRSQGAPPGASVVESGGPTRLQRVGWVSSWDLHKRHYRANKRDNLPISFLILDTS